MANIRTTTTACHTILASLNAAILQGAILGTFLFCYFSVPDTNAVQGDKLSFTIVVYWVYFFHFIPKEEKENNNNVGQDNIEVEIRRMGHPKSDFLKKQQILRVG